MKLYHSLNKYNILHYRLFHPLDSRNNIILFGTFGKEDVTFSHLVNSWCEMILSSLFFKGFPSLFQSP